MNGLALALVVFFPGIGQEAKEFDKALFKRQRYLVELSQIVKSPEILSSVNSFRRNCTALYVYARATNSKPVYTVLKSCMTGYQTLINAATRLIVENNTLSDILKNNSNCGKSTTKYELQNNKKK